MHLAITADEQQSEELSSYMMALYQNSEDQQYHKVRDLAGRTKDDPAHRLLNGEGEGRERNRYRLMITCKDMVRTRSLA